MCPINGLFHTLKQCFWGQKEAFKIKAVLSNFLKRGFHSQKSGSKAEKAACLEPLSYNIM